MSTLGQKETTISLLVCVPVNSAVVGTQAALRDRDWVRSSISVLASAWGFHVADPSQVRFHYKVKSLAALMVPHPSRYIGFL